MTRPRSLVRRALVFDKLDLRTVLVPQQCIRTESKTTSILGRKEPGMLEETAICELKVLTAEFYHETVGLLIGYGHPLVAVIIISHKGAEVFAEELKKGVFGVNLVQRTPLGIRIAIEWIARRVDLGL